MMKAILKRLWEGLVGPGAQGALVPGTGESKLGREILEEKPRRLAILSEIKDLLIDMPKDERSARVDDVAARFAAHVVDLPASERNHDAQPFGLLDHSLEVARAAVAELVRPSFRVSEDPALNYREQPIWAYSGFVLGLLHDVGKARDLEVVLAVGIAPWDPLTEPLLQYLARQGRTRSGPATWRWVKGRGLQGHVTKGEALFSLILPPDVKALLGPRLGELLSTFERSYRTADQDWGRGPAGRVVAAVRRADEEHAEKGAPPKAVKVHVAAPPVEPPAAKPAEGASSVVPASEAPDQGGGVHGSETPACVALELFPKEPTTGSTESPVSPTLDPVCKAAPPPGRGLQPRVKEPRLVPDRARLVEGLFGPERLLEAIKSWLRAGNMLRNNAHAAVLMRPDFIWLRYPDALSDLLRAKGIEWSSLVAEKLLGVLKKLPAVASENPRMPLVYARTGARASKPAFFIRLRTPGFLPQQELAGLGYWPHEMTVVPSVPVAEGERSLWPVGRQAV